MDAREGGGLYFAGSASKTCVINVENRRCSSRKEDGRGGEAEIEKAPSYLSIHVRNLCKSSE